MYRGHLKSMLLGGLLASLAFAETNANCPISGRPVKADVTLEIDDTTVAFCCPGCKGRFAALPESTRVERLAAVMTPSGDDLKKDADKPAPKANASSLTTAYLLDKCPISGKRINSMDAAAAKIIGDREIMVCCAGCFGRFEDNREKYDARVNTWIIEQQKATYPLETCLASGRPIDVKGTPTDAVAGNRLMRFCCGGCASYVIDNPERLVKAHRQLDEAYIAKVGPASVDTVCIVSGEPLGDDPVKLVVGNTVVQMCCRHCAGEFGKNPRPYLDKAKAAAKATAKARGSQTPGAGS